MFPGCLHVPAARAWLRRALLAAGLPETWTGHDVSQEPVPARLRGFGSPTILVDGRDGSGGSLGSAVSYRVDADSDVVGAPALQQIVSALRAAG